MTEMFTTGSIEDPICVGCQKRPEEIPEYSMEATDSGLEPAAYVIAEEGTLNTSNGHFLCTDCYIKAGMPTSPHGWVAP
jgi:hypothetical protein